MAVLRRRHFHISTSRSKWSGIGKGVVSAACANITVPLPKQPTTLAQQSCPILLKTEIQTIHEPLRRVFLSQTTLCVNPQAFATQTSLHFFVHPYYLSTFQPSCDDFTNHRHDSITFDFISGILQICLFSIRYRMQSIK